VDELEVKDPELVFIRERLAAIEKYATGNRLGRREETLGN